MKYSNHKQIHPTSAPESHADSSSSANTASRTYPLIKTAKIAIIRSDEAPFDSLFENALKQIGVGGIEHYIAGDKDPELIISQIRCQHSKHRILILDHSLPADIQQQLSHAILQNFRFIQILVLQKDQDAIPGNLLSQTFNDHISVLFVPCSQAQFSAQIYQSFRRIEHDQDQIISENEMIEKIAELKAVETHFKYRAAHDELTGLYNRRRLEQILEVSIMRSQVDNKPSAVLYLDLDQFKLINTCEGQQFGNILLRVVADEMRQLINGNEILSRIGADDFILVIEDCDEKSAVQRAETFRKHLDGFQFDTEGNQYHISASIGVAIIQSDNACSSNEILSQAEQACLVAKSQGRNVTHLYDSHDIDTLNLKKDAFWSPQIREALANNRFELYFQPVLDVCNDEIKHYEALVRLNREDGHVYGPHDFIPVAERVGLIHEIDRWVVKRAIDILSELDKQERQISLNVNLSGHAFQDPQLLHMIQDSLRKNKLDAGKITFEITETAAVANFSQTRNMVEHLRKLGCKFALDDFGAGFNTYNYLKHFPVDYLKIDGAFITSLVQDEIDQALVKSMIEIAHTLGKQVVAEYVENEETLDLLKQYGIDYAQGYLIGRPAPRLN